MRYFIEVAYHGRNYAGFQVQHNARTIQSEVEKAMETCLRQPIPLTGSSRTDAGVHARQNFFHADTALHLTSRHVYSINAILPADIALLSIRQVLPAAHCRFDATARSYRYYIYHGKNPFYTDRAWYYPYPLHLDNLNNVAGLLLGQHDFTSFSKRNTQVKTMQCTSSASSWHRQDDMLVYAVQGNRFLRGMVRGLVATMLRAGRGALSANAFAGILAAKDCSKADFSAPAHGLFLEQVCYPDGFFDTIVQ